MYTCISYVHTHTYMYDYLYTYMYILRPKGRRQGPGPQGPGPSGPRGRKNARPIRTYGGPTRARPTQAQGGPKTYICVRVAAHSSPPSQW